MNRVGIIGFTPGGEGESAFRYWQRQGADITLYYWEGGTTQQDLPTDVETRRWRKGEPFGPELARFDLIVRTPPVHPGMFPAGERVTTVTAEFLARCPAPVMAVSGTKGKGTTASLIARMLEAGGQHVHLGGNIGVPALDLLDDVEATDWVVLELSSFQLSDLPRSPHLGAMLRVTPDHLDYHADFAEYVAAKGRLFQFQHSDDVAIYNRDCPHASALVGLSPGRQVSFGKHGDATVCDGVVRMMDVPIAEDRGSLYSVDH